MANALRPDKRGTIVLRAHYEHHNPDDNVDIRVGRHMHVCCATCDPWNDPPFTMCWYTWFSSEQRQQIRQHLADYHPKMFQVLYRCPIDRHHDKKITDLDQWLDHLHWECGNINDADSEDGADQQDNNEETDDDTDDEDNEEEPQAPESDEDAEENVVQHEYQQILHDNMEMLAVNFQNEDDNDLNNYNIEVGFYQCSTEEDEDDDDADADTDEAEEMDESL